MSRRHATPNLHISTTAGQPTRQRALRNLLSARRMQCYIVTMDNPPSPHPLSPTAGAGARLVLAAVVLGVVWLAVLWALS